MKNIIKLIGLLLIISFFSQIGLGYNFSFRNELGQKIKNIELQLVGIDEPYHDSGEIGPGKTYIFSFYGLRAGFCIANILVDLGGSLNKIHGKLLGGSCGDSLKRIYQPGAYKNQIWIGPAE